MRSIVQLGYDVSLFFCFKGCKYNCLQMLYRFFNRIKWIEWYLMFGFSVQDNRECWNVVNQRVRFVFEVYRFYYVFDDCYDNLLLMYFL